MFMQVWTTYKTNVLLIGFKPFLLGLRFKSAIRWSRKVHLNNTNIRPIPGLRPRIPGPSTWELCLLNNHIKTSTIIKRHHSHRRHHHHQHQHQIKYHHRMLIKPFILHSLRVYSFILPSICNISLL